MHVLLAVMLSTPLAATGSPPAQPAQPPVCNEWRECRRLALEAAEQKDYETFHNLAWRAVQTGAKNDPSLLYLLARAQSVSGRPHDALVMLRRLAAMGVAAIEAETSDDFRRTRSLPGWPEVAASIEAVARTGRIATAGDVPTDDSPGEPARVVARPEGRDEGLRFAGASLAPVALAYDAVSQRFVLADDRSETLKVIDERSRHVVDLVSPRWAGLYRTTALEIDSRQGNLWTVGAHDADPNGQPRTAIHKLQLVSGRLLDTVPLPVEAGAARFADVAVTRRSTVFVLDSAGRRIFRLGPRARSLELETALTANDPTSLAPAGEAVIYVAHPAGIVRLDLATNTSAPVRAGRDVNLQGLQWIRWYDRSLLGIQKTPDGGRAAVRIRFDRRGRTATSLEVLDAGASRGATVTGGVFHYFGSEPDGGAAIVRRLQLR